MKRNKFNLSFYKLLTANMGKMVPVGWYEVLPGDTIQQHTSALIRVSPLEAPIMHPVKVRFHHWFVPNRLIWSEFEDFITGGESGTSTPIHPYCTKDHFATTEGSLSDYFGIPPATYTNAFHWSALPVRAYNLIFNEHYRDQQLTTARTVATNSGEDITSSGSVENVCWEKDYFTSARPDATLGASVTVPVAAANVYGIGTVGSPGATGVAVNETGTGSDTYADAWAAATAGDVYIEENPSVADEPYIRTEETTIDINDLKLATALQRYQDARNKYGARYVEYLRYLGVRPSDARLQVPEYLGGGRQIIQFSEVLQSDTAVGTMYGHGISAMRTNRFRRFFDEHGIVMTIMSVIPKTIYASCVPRPFLRSVKEDYFQRELAHIGDQEITNREVYSEHTSYTATFGYQGRYDEYRRNISGIAGDFHSNLNHWHMARIYASDPALNDTFVSCSPTDRIYSSTTYDQLYCMVNHGVVARRMMPKQA